MSDLEPKMREFLLEEHDASDLMSLKSILETHLIKFQAILNSGIIDKLEWELWELEFVCVNKKYIFKYPWRLQPFFYVFLGPSEVQMQKDASRKRTLIF
jgi:hypothetical protein